MMETSMWRTESAGSELIAAMTKDETIRLQAAEIERLREELSHCLHLDNHNAIVRNLQKAAVAVTAERDAEIERLRELLRRHLDWIAADGTGVSRNDMRQWVKHVREALSD